MPASKSSTKPRIGMGLVNGGKFTSHNLMKTNPLREQFAPTDAQPIRQRARMGGDPAPDSEAAAEVQQRKDITPGTPPSQKSDRRLHTEAARGDKGAKAELIRRIGMPVQ